MADKMLRMAGRGDDATAKAVSTDNDGRVKSLIYALDVNGNKVPLTTELDEQGKAVLRIADVAPAGYDADLDVVKVLGRINPTEQIASSYNPLQGTPSFPGVQVISLNSQLGINIAEYEKVGLRMSRSSTLKNSSNEYVRIAVGLYLNNQETQIGFKAPYDNTSLVRYNGQSGHAMDMPIEHSFRTFILNDFFPILNGHYPLVGVMLWLYFYDTPVDGTLAITFTGVKRRM